MARSLWVASAASAMAGASLVWFLKGTPVSEVKPNEAIIPESAVEAKAVVETARDTRSDGEEGSGDHELTEPATSARAEDPLEEADTNGKEDEIPNPNSSFWSTDALRTGFGREPRDPSWGPAAETQIMVGLSNLMAANPLRVIVQEIECRTETCRVLLMHESQPKNWTELQNQGWYVTEMVRELVAQSSVVSGARINHKGGYPAELATSELFLYRSGYAGIATSFSTPFTPRDR